jgi:RNA recognition motif-containing protein
MLAHDDDTDSGFVEMHIDFPDETLMKPAADAAAADAGAPAEADLPCVGEDFAFDMEVDEATELISRSGDDGDELTSKSFPLPSHAVSVATTAEAPIHSMRFCGASGSKNSIANTSGYGSGSSNVEEGVSNILVAGLALTVADAELKTWFQHYDSFISATVKIDLKGKSRGFGFVRLRDVEEAKHAIDSMNAKVIGESTLRVVLSIHNGDAGDCETVFVRNFPIAFDKKEVDAFFSTFGGIRSMTSAADTFPCGQLVKVQYIDAHSARRVVKALHNLTLVKKPDGTVVDLNHPLLATSRTKPPGMPGKKTPSSSASSGSRAVHSASRVSSSAGGIYGMLRPGQPGMPMPFVPDMNGIMGGSPPPGGMPMMGQPHFGGTPPGGGQPHFSGTPSPNPQRLSGMSPGFMGSANVSSAGSSNYGSGSGGNLHGGMRATPGIGAAMRAAGTGALDQQLSRRGSQSRQQPIQPVAPQLLQQPAPLQAPLVMQAMAPPPQQQQLQGISVQQALQPQQVMHPQLAMPAQQQQQQQQHTMQPQLLQMPAAQPQMAQPQQYMLVPIPANGQPAPAGGAQPMLMQGAPQLQQAPQLGGAQMMPQMMPQMQPMVAQQPMMQQGGLWAAQ